MKRELTLEQACSQYPHRFTMEHKPGWADSKTEKGYYAPQYASDREWYENTRFPGESDHVGPPGACYSTGATWPIGQWLELPYQAGGFYPLKETPQRDPVAIFLAARALLACYDRDRGVDNGIETDPFWHEHMQSGYESVAEACLKVATLIEDVALRLVIFENLDMTWRYWLDGHENLLEIYQACSSDNEKGIDFDNLEKLIESILRDAFTDIEAIKEN